MDPATKRPRVLVAGSEDAIAMVRRAIGAEVDVVAARSIEEATAELDKVDVVVCNARFHESRLFDFLIACRRQPRRVPVICCRNRISWYGIRSMRLALHELGVDEFVDVALLEQRLGVAAAGRALREAVLTRFK